MFDDDTLTLFTYALGLSLNGVGTGMALQELLRMYGWNRNHVATAAVQILGISLVAYAAYREQNLKCSPRFDFVPFVDSKVNQNMHCSSCFPSCLCDAYKY